MLLILFVCSANAFAMTQQEMDAYDHKLYPQSVYNDGINKSPQDTIHNFNISPATGTANVKITDVSLKGINGLDLNLTRTYDSSQANLLEPYVKEIASYTYVNYYEVVGKKDFEKRNTSNVMVDCGYDYTICINSKYYNYTTGDSKYINMSVFEYANTSTPATANLFANYSDATALCDILNNTNPDISATNPNSSVGYYWADYKQFSVVSVSVPIYTPQYQTALLEDTGNERYCKLGAGWSFDFPYIEKRYGSDCYEYLHYADKGSWKIDFTSNGGSNHLAGYPLNDIILNYDNSITHDGKASVYSVTEKDGKKSYYANDGRLLLIRDRFGNEIKFYHDTDVFKDTLGNGHSYPYIYKIVDTVGREITFSYGTLQITATINDTTNSQNNRVIKYNKEKISNSSLGGLYDYEYILKSVEKPNGDVSTYSYWNLSAPLNFFDRNTAFYYANQKKLIKM